MEKTITIIGEKVKLKTSGAFAIRYKSQFKRDPISDIMKLYKGLEVKNKKDEENEFMPENFDTEVFLNMVWVLAKTADASIKEPFDWLDDFETFPIMEILPEVMELISASLGTTVVSKKK